MNATQEMNELLDRWADAEVVADVTALDAMACDGFRLVGPFGFVLDRGQWLDRYRSGRLTTSTLSLDEREIEVRGDVAIAISVQVQTASHEAQRADGRFRTTHIAVRGASGWLLAGQHLSVMTPPHAT